MSWVRQIFLGLLLGLAALTAFGPRDPVQEVGSFVETDNGVWMDGWVITDGSLTLDQLRDIAKRHGTYQDLRVDRPPLRGVLAP